MATPSEPCAECTRLRELIARAYRAYCKPAWEEGECFDEVAADLALEGIDYSEMLGEARDADTE